ncbi:MAG: aspartate 1-decarboxylase [Blastochloris sp.]|jgi:aspartate 1-decarboxylase|nr:aspartate 1-decarboxylase [Blastochloris sp.]
MLRHLLKSKLHRAFITDANVEYEGSITIPEDLMGLTNLWEGEKVLVTSITSGARLETYVQKGVAGSGKIIVNGGAAHLIKQGERVSIMAFASSDIPIEPRRILCNDQNEVISTYR